MIHYSLPLKQRSVTGFTVRDIEIPTSTANVVEVTMTERYPKEGFAVNTESEMIVLILEGSVTIPGESKKLRLPEGSTVFVPKNTPYYWDPIFVKLYIVSTPPWTPQQQRLLPE